MSKEKVLNYIENNIYGDFNQRKELYDYISGEKSDEPASLNNIQFYYNIIELYDKNEEENEEFYKLINTLSKKTPNILTNVLYHTQSKYKIYKEANVSKDFVKNDISYVIYNDCIRGFIYYYNNSNYENFCYIYDAVYEYYSDIIDEFICSYKKLKDSKIVTAMIFMITKIKKGDKTLLKDFENIIYNIIKCTYANGKIQRILDEYIDNEAVKDYYKNLEELNNIKELKSLPIKNNLEDMLFNICYNCIGISPILEGAAKIVFTISKPLIYTKFSYQVKDIEGFIQKNKIPLETKLRYYSYILVSNQNVNIQEIFKVLEENSQTNFDEYKKTMKLLMSENDITFSLLLSVLLKNNKLNEEEKTEYTIKTENIIISKLRDSYRDNTRIIFSDESMKDFEFLRQDEISMESIDSNYLYYFHDFKTLVVSSLVMLNYSKVANNTIKLLIEISHGVISYNLYPLDYHEAFYPDMKENIFDNLYYNVKVSLQNICALYIHSGQYYEERNKTFIKFLLSHKQEAEEGIEKFNFENHIMHKYINILYQNDIGFDYKYLMNAFNKKSKLIADCTENILKEKEKEARPFVEELLNAKSKIARDSAMRLIRIWDNDKIEKQLNDIKTLEQLTQYISTLYSKNNDKNTPYRNEVNYGNIRAANSDEKLPDMLTKFYVSEYILLKDLYIIKTCKKIQEFANPFDFRNLIKSIYDMWISEGASTKYKNILFPFALTAGESQIAELKKQIDFWSENSKPGLAAFAVQSLCMNGSKMALLLTDTMSKKHKNKKIRNAALEALDILANELGISREELDDLIIPDLGFDKNRIKTLNYGERKFKAILDSKLNITLSDESGKVIKSLPKASAKFNDNEELVSACKEDLKFAKKQIKLIIDSQKPRISNAIISERKWSIKKWTALFVENPIMNCFATGLIWLETDDKGNKIGTFRYMEDGTFNTVDEDEYSLNENSFITLLHPADADEEEIEAWKEQLEDYEIIQPVEQLEIPVYKLKEEEFEKTSIENYKNKKIYGATFKSIITKMGLSPCFDDYGECNGGIYSDDNSEIKMVIHTSSFYLGDYNSSITVKNIDFHKYESDYENSVVTRSRVALKDIPKKLLSFALMVGNNVTARTLNSEEE